jgi:dienelactone hydrolase
VSPWRRWIVASLALLAIGASLWQLHQGRHGVDIVHAELNATPVTIFTPRKADRAPVVVIAHGFAGSQQLMQSFALALARAGYVAVTFDFLGHGRHPNALQGSITEEAGATKALVEQLGEVVAFARTLPQGDGRIGLLGHSMASDIVVRYGQQAPDVQATVAVSMFAPGVTATSPRNLLVIVGGLEAEALKAEARRAVTMAAANPKPNATYGDFSAGTARRMTFPAGVEHVSVLFSQDAAAEASRWFDMVFGRETHSAAPIGSRGGFIALLFLGLTLLAWILAPLLPVVSPEQRGAGLTWRQFLPLAILPALLTPLILWKFPTDFLPILVGDYLAAHFALYGGLTALGLMYVTRKPPRKRGARTSISMFGLAVAALAFYGLVVFGVAIDHFLTSFVPVGGRFVLVIAMLAGTLPYFLADEWLTRGPGAPSGAYLFTKLCFLISLAIAVALNPEKLFFLIIILPVIVMFFLIYGLFSAWAYRQTNDPRVAGLANGFALAWAIAVTFPMLAR